MYFDGSKRVDRGEFVVGEEELNRVVNQILHMEDIFNKLLAVIYLYPKSHSRLSRISKEIVLEVYETAALTRAQASYQAPIPTTSDQFDHAQQHINSVQFLMGMPSNLIFNLPGLKRDSFEMLNKQ